MRVEMKCWCGESCVFDGPSDGIVENAFKWLIEHTCPFRDDKVAGVCCDAEIGKATGAGATSTRLSAEILRQTKNMKEYIVDQAYNVKWNPSYW